MGGAPMLSPVELTPGQCRRLEKAFTNMIRLYRDSDQSAVIKLVLRIQNDEFQLGITLSDQPDLSHINASYCDKSGGFWVAEEAGAIVGCIGLMALSPEIGVLKKFFVDQAFRGHENGISSSLFSALTSFAPTRGLKSIVLDTPSVAKRSHAFYRRAGFCPISKDELPVPYEYPDRDSLLFRLVLPTGSTGTDSEQDKATDS